MNLPIAPAPQGLPALEERLRQDLTWLELPAKNWLSARQLNGQDVLDVAIVGGGMAGMAAAAALAHVGIQAPMFDRAPAGQEGPWATTARMEILGSPKQLTGPCLGLPALTFRAWFEAQFGSQAWEELDKIPRLQWMDYLRWYRRVLQLDMRNQHNVLAVQPRSDGVVELRMQTPAGPQTMLARRVVLATGRDGLGDPYVPEFARKLPHSRWAHSSDVMDYALLAGKRVGVIGADASAMDSAGAALEAGAARVDLLIRHDDTPRINKGLGADNPELSHDLILSDAWKWKIRHDIHGQQTPPSRDSILRVSGHPNARFHMDCGVQDAAFKDDAVRVRTPQGVFSLDFLIFSTGFRIDWHARPEYAPLAPHVRSWRDRYPPEAGQPDQERFDSPDLGPVFELQEKTPGACPGLERVHCFSYPAALSHGMVPGDIPAINDGARRLAQGLASLFSREDMDTHYANQQADDVPEIHGDEGVPADTKAAGNTDTIG